MTIKAVASAAPSIKPTTKTLSPSEVTMKTGNRLWISSEEMSISMLTKPSTQIPGGIFFSVWVGMDMHKPYRS